MHFFLLNPLRAEDNSTKVKSEEINKNIGQIINEEEKDRGITIDLGFAYWRDDVTIIDVPGHEKFIRNMVAGVSTIDFFILSIKRN